MQPGTAIEPEGQNSDLVLSKYGVIIGSASSDICCLKIWEGIAVFEVQFDAHSGWNCSKFWLLSEVGAVVAPVLPVPPTLHPISATAMK